MLLVYGSYQFGAGGVEIGHTVSTEFDRFGRPLQRTRRYTVSGRLLVTEGLTTVQGQNDLVAQETALAAALAIPNQNLIFTTDDGTRTLASLLVLGSVSGVRITAGPDFTTTTGAEYATIRSFSFTAEAVYPAGILLGNNLVEYTETVTFSGGGMLRRTRPAIKGPPVRQIIYQQTPYRAVQTGSATGYLAYPIVPPPLFPSDLVEAPEYSKSAPEWKGLRFENYKITWSYSFESPTILSAVPRLVTG